MTVMEAVVAAARSEDGITAVSCVALTKVVASAAPLKSATVVLTKPSPVNVMVVSGLPVWMDVGLRLVSVGVRGCTSKAPMSTGPTKREKPGPRWSVVSPAAVAAALLPASMAALPVCNAIVSVRPPLFCKPAESSIGFPPVAKAPAPTMLLVALTVSVPGVLAPPAVLLTRTLVPPVEPNKMLLTTLVVASTVPPSGVSPSTRL